MAQNKLIISQVMMPNQTNPSGNIYGGDIMKMMDSAAYAVTRKYARCNVVTARVDELEFHLPILVGDLVTCTAEIVFAVFTSTMRTTGWRARQLPHASSRARPSSTALP